MENIEYFKTALLNEKQSIEEELKDIALFNTDTNIWEARPDQELMGESDENEAADRFEDFEERNGLVTTLQARLTDINDALTKMETGTYGVCEVSGEQIEKDRLEANPAARTCKAHINE